MESISEASIDLVITDPPYLVDYRPEDGRRCTNDDTNDWLEPAFRGIYRVMKPNSCCVSFYGWPAVDRFMQVWKACGFRPVSHLVWVKSHCSRDGYTQGHHEVAFLLAKGKPQWPWDSPSDVLPWEYTGNEHHPNQKPIIGLVPLIEAFSRLGEVILDPFAGSGTTALAARSCERNFILIEKEFYYCQVARHRLATGGNRATGQRPAWLPLPVTGTRASRTHARSAEREAL